MTSASDAARRALLATAANPRPTADYLVMLEAQTTRLKLILRYVPDRVVLLPEGLQDYANAVPEVGAAPLEAWTMSLLDDLDDVLLARYLEVTVQRDNQRVLSSLRQPRWDNPALLARLD